MTTIAKIAEKLAEAEAKGEINTIRMSTEEIIAFVVKELREHYPAAPELVVGSDYAPRWVAPAFQTTLDAILSEHAERKGEG